MFLNQGGLIDKIFGGFEISGLMQWTSGAPITFVDTRGTFNRAGRSARQTPSSNLTNDQIRALSERLSMRPQIGERQVALIFPAERMNSAAANALLKTLEEPTPDTHLLLVADRIGQLPATIRSRCQRLPVAPVSDDEGIAALATFVIVGLALYLLEREEMVFFEKTQQEQAAFFTQTQAELSRTTERAARKSLLAAQEAANENMTGLLANVLWDSDETFIAIHPSNCQTTNCGVRYAVG